MSNPFNASAANARKAKVLRECSVYESKQAVGSVVEVDETTFNNLSKKGWLEAVADEPETPKGKGGK
jgi:hypothetical protein